MASVVYRPILYYNPQQKPWTYEVAVVGGAALPALYRPSKYGFTRGPPGRGTNSTWGG